MYRRGIGTSVLRPMEVSATTQQPFYSPLSTFSVLKIDIKLRLDHLEVSIAGLFDMLAGVAQTTTYLVENVLTDEQCPILSNTGHASIRIRRAWPRLLRSAWRQHFRPEAILGVTAHRLARIYGREGAGAERGQEPALT